MKKNFLKNEHGLAMPELLVAISIILIVLTSSAFVLITGLRTQTENEDRDTAVQLIRDEIEKARAMKFSDLSLDGTHLHNPPGYEANQFVVDFTHDDIDHEEMGVESYADKPLVDPVLSSDGLSPWTKITRGADVEQDIPGLDYFVRTDVTYYSPDNETDYRSKEVSVTAYWNNGNKKDSVTMSWIRTPSLSEAEPSGTDTEDAITLRAPTDVSYTYNALGTHMDVSWYFEQSEVSESQLSFEVFLGTPSNMQRVRTEAGAARNSITIPVDGATHLYVRAVYRGETADSPLITLTSPTVVTPPEAPSISGAQVPGTTTSTFSFSSVSQGQTYSARYRVNEGTWVNLGLMNPSTNWESPTLDSGGKVEFAVYASNIAGSSDMAVHAVNIVGKPEIPVISEPRQSRMDAIFRFSPAARADSYRAQWRLNDGSWQNISSPTPNRDIVLNGQEPGNVVHFRVASHSNLSGTSEYADISYEMLPPPPEPEIYVSAQRPGIAVFGFEESPSAESYEAAWKIGSASWKTLSDVEPGVEIHIPWTASTDQTVDFRVRAFNDVTGYSGYSTASVDMKTPPVSPTISAATQVGGEARFTFQSVARAQGYLVESQVGSEGDWMVVDEATPNTAITVTGSGAHGEIISLRVTAMNSDYGDSDSSLRTVTMLGRPDAPNVIKAEQEDKDAVFRFEPSAYAQSYRLEYQVGEGNAWQNYSNPQPDTDIHIAGNSRMNELVTIRAWASNVAGESEMAESSVNLVGPPDQPVITLNEQRLMKAYFNFEEAVGADFYHVHYRINSGSWTTLDPGITLPGVEIEVPAAAGQTVHFEIWASNASGTSAVSKSSVRLVAPPGTPVIDLSEQTNRDAATFRYTAVSGAVSYDVQTRVGGGSWQDVNVNPGVSHAVTGLSSGDNAEFRVRAHNPGGTSEWSTASVTIIPPPASPTWSPVPYQNGDSAYFRFTSVTGATSYTVRYRIDSGAWSTLSDASPGSNITIPANGNQTVTMTVTANNVAGPSSTLTGTVDMVALPAAPSFDFATQSDTTTARFRITSAARADSYEGRYRIRTGSSWSGYTNVPDLKVGISEYITTSNGSRVEFQARSLNAAGYSSWTTATVDVMNPPDAPTWNYNQQQNASNARFRFNAVSNADSYDVQYRRNGSSWVDTSGSPGTLIHISGTAQDVIDVRVRAVNMGGTSSWRTTSVTFMQMPGMPTFSMEEQTSASNIRFRFNSSNRAESYDVQYRRYSGSWGSWTNHSVKTPGSNINVSVSANQRAQVRVRACNISGCGGYRTSSVVYHRGVPAPPVWRTYNANNQSYGRAQWRFNSSSYATEYRTRHRVFPNNYTPNPGYVARSAGTIYIINAGAGGHKMQSAVRACNASGCSSWSYSGEVITQVEITSSFDWPTVRAMQWWLDTRGISVTTGSNYRWDGNSNTQRALQQRLWNRGHRHHAIDGDFAWYSVISLQDFLRSQGHTVNSTGSLNTLTRRTTQIVINDRAL